MNEDFIVRAGENQEAFETGSKRGDASGKPRYDLIPTEALERLAMVYTRGMEKYGERNWEMGQPMSRFYASAFRHLIALAQGDTVEDHAAQAMFNLAAIIHHSERIEAGELPASLADTEWAARLTWRV